MDTPKPRPQRRKLDLQARWSKKDGGDIEYKWSDAAKKEDARLIHLIFTGLDVVGEHRYSQENCFLKELERRGYDLRTLKLSVSKKSSG